MTRKITKRGLVEHLCWDKNDRHKSKKSILKVEEVFESDDELNDLELGFYKAFEQAWSHTTDKIEIATMPQVIAISAMSGVLLQLKTFVNTLSEESILIDSHGKLSRKGDKIYMCIHGGAFITPEKLSKAMHGEISTNWGIGYTKDEVQQLLSGRVGKSKIPIYHIEDMSKNPDPFGRYAVWNNFDECEIGDCDTFDYEGFMKNKIVQARAGSLEYLNRFSSQIIRDTGTVMSTFERDIDDIEYGEGRLLSANIDGFNGTNSMFGKGRFWGIVKK